MGIGFGGFLRFMNDTIKHNRELLGKRKSLKEIHQDESRIKSAVISEQSQKNASERVALRPKYSRTQELFGRLIFISMILSFFAAGAWHLHYSYKDTVAKSETTPQKPFRTVISNEANGLQLKTDYYHDGPRASETFLKNSYKHQNSESYYSTGEQFRSALYYYDTLVTEVYFFKTGDTIPNFPQIQDQEVHPLKFINSRQKKLVSFDFYDGKVILNTYQEKLIE